MTRPVCYNRRVFEKTGGFDNGGTIRSVIITGMSGAGKTVAVQSFEDLGYFVIDNMIPSVATKFVDAVKQSGEITRMAMVMDSRSRGFYDQVVP